MSFTLDTFHFEISFWNDVARMKMSLMSVILDTSHSPIDPCAPLEQFNSREYCRQVTTALFSSALDCGENTNRSAQKFGETQIRMAKKMSWWQCIHWRMCGCMALSPLSACSLGIFSAVCIGVVSAHKLPEQTGGNLKTCQMISRRPQESEPVGTKIMSRCIVFGDKRERRPRLNITCNCVTKDCLYFDRISRLRMGRKGSPGVLRSRSRLYSCCRSLLQLSSSVHK